MAQLWKKIVQKFNVVDIFSISIVHNKKLSCRRRGAKKQLFTATLTRNIFEIFRCFPKTEEPPNVVQTYLGGDLETPLKGGLFPLSSMSTSIWRNI